MSIKQKDKGGIVMTIQEIIHQGMDCLNNGGVPEEIVEILQQASTIDQDVALLVTEDKGPLKGLHRELITLLQSVYNDTSDEIIADSTYDELYAYMKDLGEDDIVGSQTAAVIEVKKLYQHRYPELRGTLDKVHFVTEKERKEKKDKKTSIEGWVKSCERALGRDLTVTERRVALFPKWDGVSVVFEGTDVTEHALKRGFTSMNEAHSIELFEGLPMPIDTSLVEGHIGLKTEVVMSKEQFESFCEDVQEMKSPRSAVSSIINSDNTPSDYLNYLTVVPLQQTDGKRITPFIKGSLNEGYSQLLPDIKDYQALEFAINQIADEVSKDGYPIDGVVLRLLDESVQDELGRQEAINKYEVAYKITAERAVTEVIDVIFSLGKLGAVTPVLKVKPVKMAGNTVQNCSLGSYALFKAKDLHVGDLVTLTYNIIPYVERVVHTHIGPKIEPKIECPSCGSPMMITTSYAMCTNPECDGLVQGQILNYVSKMRIDNISYATIDDLFKVGYLTNIADLYDLHEFRTQIESMMGYGPVSVQRILDGINSRKSVFPHEFLGALGIRGIGRRIFKKIFDSGFTYEDIIDRAAHDKEDLITDLAKLDGIGLITAQQIAEGLNVRMKQIRKIEKELTFKEIEKPKEYRFSVCFTKIRDKEFEKYLESINVKVEGNYKKTIKYLVVPSRKETSSKIEKAIKDGVEIITLEEIKDLAGYTEK